MRKFLAIFFGVVLIFMLTSCSDDDDGFGFPSDFDDLANSYDIDIRISRDDYNRSYIDVELEAFTEPEECSLTVGGNEFTNFDWYYSEDGDYEEWYYSFSFSEEDLETDEEGYFSFDIMFNGKTSTGELHISPLLEADFPEDYEFNSNLTFSWEAEFEPQLYSIWMYYEYGDFDNDEYGYNEDGKQLSGSKTSYTIPKSFCSCENADYEWLYIYIDAINFVSQDDILFWSFSSQSHEYGDDMWYKNISHRRNMHNLKDHTE